jgi:hypothetical protein
MVGEDDKIKERRTRLYGRCSTVHTCMVSRRKPRRASDGGERVELKEEEGDEG